MKAKNIDLSMVHFGINDKDGGIIINTDLLLKKGIYNNVVSFIIDGYEPDIQQDAIIYANKIENSTKSELIEIKELMNERSRLCILREDKKYIDLYDSLIRTVEERILTLPDVKEKHKQLSIPVELDTPEARKIFEKAIDAGLIKRSDKLNAVYMWQDEKQLLAYFAEKMSLRFNLGKIRNGEQTINWIIFQSIFNVSNIKGAKYDDMKDKFKFSPPGYEIVDKLFE